MELLSDFSSIRRLVSSRNDLFGGAFVILAARSFEVNERVNMFTRQRPRPSNERRKEGMVGKERVCRLVAAACRDAHGAPEGFRIRRSQTSCKRVCPEVLRWNRRFRRFGSAGSDLTGRRTPSKRGGGEASLIYAELQRATPGWGRLATGLCLGGGACRGDWVRRCCMHFSSRRPGSKGCASVTRMASHHTAKSRESAQSWPAREHSRSAAIARPIACCCTGRVRR